MSGSALCFKCTQQHFLLLIPKSKLANTPNFYPRGSACSVGCVTFQPWDHLISRSSLPTSWICHLPFFFFFKLLSLCPTVKLWGDTSRSAQLSVALVSGTWSYGTCSFHLTSFYPPQNQRNDSVRCCLNTIRSTKMSWSWRSATSWTF